MTGTDKKARVPHHKVPKHSAKASPIASATPPANPIRLPFSHACDSVFNLPLHEKGV